MARPVEKALIAVVLAGIALVVIVLWRPVHTPEAAGTTATTSEVATAAATPRTSAAKRPSSASSNHPPTGGPVANPVDTRSPIGTRATTVALSPGGSTGSEASHPTVPSPASSAATTRVASTTGPPTTTAPPPSTEASAASTARASTTGGPPSTALPDTGVPEVPQRCASVEEVWKWDGHPVEDPCTLAEVKRVMRWAWTGTDDQRRSAIRNSHLLDDVFAGLEEVGRKEGYGIFHSETRGEWTVGSRNIRWHGGPHFDRAVIAVDYTFRHPENPPYPWWTVTLVQIDGDWKLSYRRGYCRMVTPSLEYHGLEARCLPDPDPEVNEDEYPDAIEDS